MCIGRSRNLNDCHWCRKCRSVHDLRALDALSHFFADCDSCIQSAQIKSGSAPAYLRSDFVATKLSNIARFVVISCLPTLPDGSGEGGRKMTKPNQIQKSDDFKLAIVIRIEGSNSRALVLRFVGIAAALITVAVKLALIFMARAH